MLIHQDCRMVRRIYLILLLYRMFSNIPPQNGSQASPRAGAGGLRGVSGLIGPQHSTFIYCPTLNAERRKDACVSPENCQFIDFFAIEGEYYLSFSY